MKSKPYKFLDLFAGAGGLSEGFINAGYSPIAHVESDQAACLTLRTRMAWHWLKSQNKKSHYISYLKGLISRDEFYALIPDEQLRSVINIEISEKLLPSIFRQVDECLKGEKLDLIVGGPPCQAYSVVGRARDKNRMMGDARNYLYRYYAEFLKRYKPAYFVFENVLGLLSAKDENDNLYLDTMQKVFREAGYETEYQVQSSQCQRGSIKSLF